MFVEEVIIPDAHAREEDGKRPSPDVFQKMAAVNLFAMRLGPGPHLKGLTLMNGLVKPEEFDYFHEMIIGQEIARINARGYGDGLAGGTCIGMFATKDIASVLIISLDLNFFDRSSPRYEFRSPRTP